jgi:hypothetical protein
VVKPQTHKREDRPVQSHDLSSEVPTLNGEEAAQADQPVAADAAQEDLDPGWGDLAGGGGGDEGGAPGVAEPEAAVCDQKSLSVIAGGDGRSGMGGGV